MALAGCSIAFACATPQTVEQQTTEQPDLDQPCLALVASPPERWSETLPAVLVLGPRAAPPLSRALAAKPEAAGRQAALCALGELGNREAVPFLIEQATGDRAHAYEAALALGKLGDPRAVAPLRDLAAAPSRDITVRTAAACALLDLGHDDDAAPLLQAVLLAGTPYGEDSALQCSLPRKSRWALERVLVIDAIARFTGGETFGLDPDASWPRLRDGAQRFAEHIAASR